MVIDLRKLRFSVLAVAGALLVGLTATSARADCPGGTTDPDYCTPGAPKATTAAATAITVNGATLNGTVNPNGASTTYHFEYGKTTSYGSKTSARGGRGATPDANAGSDYVDHNVSATVSGLEPNTTYHFRIVSSSGRGNANGADITFVTSSPAVTAPTVTTEPATDATNAGATLNGTVNPNGTATTYQFEYGPTATYGTRTTAGDAGSDSTVHPVSTAIIGLLPNTTYHFRAIAKNGGGEVTGSDRTFITAAAGAPVGHQAAPTATTLGATGVALTAATLNGSVRPNGLVSQYAFQYGTTTAYDGSTPAALVPGAPDFSEHPVSRFVSGLLPGTTYHYRLAAANSLGLTFGRDLTFVTPAKPKPVLSIDVRPERDETKPYGYKATGMLAVPGGTDAAQVCVGMVTVKVRRGRRLVGSDATPLKANCTYAKAVVVTTRPQRIKGRGRHHGKLHVRSYFEGNNTLSKTRSAKVTVAYGEAPSR